MTGGFPEGNLSSVYSPGYGVLHVNPGDIIVHYIPTGDGKLIIAERFLVIQIEPMPDMQFDGREWITQALVVFPMSSGRLHVITWTPERVVLRYGVIRLDSPSETVEYPVSDNTQ